MKFLIDECLSLELVSVATQLGHEAYHVAHIGRSGWKDWNIARHANDGDLILVTNNGNDFRKIYATQALHAGLIIIVPNVSRDAQSGLFDFALDQLSAIGEPINKVIEIDLDGDDFTYRVYDLPVENTVKS
jgi:predicted nuclease of predicted toxin-antitoxin system